MTGPDDDTTPIDVVRMRVCKRCGHEQCPCCPDWCDVLLYTRDDSGHIPASELDASGEPDWPVLCCGGECDYSDD